MDGLKQVVEYGAIGLMDTSGVVAVGDICFVGAGMACDAEQIAGRPCMGELQGLSSRPVNFNRA